MELVKIEGINLKMEVVGSSETSVNSSNDSRCKTPENRQLNSHGVIMCLLLYSVWHTPD